MLTREERKGKLLFKDSEKFSKVFRVKWGILLSPTLFVVGVFMAILGFWLISNSQASLEKIAVSSIVIFMGVTMAIIGVLYTSATLDARPLAVYEQGLDIPIRPFKWMLKGRSHFIAFKDLSDIEQRVVERGEYYAITTKSGELLTIPYGTVSNIEKVRHLLAESSRKIQHEEEND